MPGDRSPAIATLLAAVRAAILSSPTASWPDEAPLGTEWPEVLALAEAHRIAPLLQRAIRSSPPPSVPAGFAARLDDVVRAGAARSLAALGPFAEVARLYEARQIPFLAWKGPALSLELWGDAALRRFSDLDLVVRPSDRTPARALAASLGWRPIRELHAAQERALFAARGSWELTRTGTDVLLEVHWAFSSRRYPGRLAVSDVLARSRSLAVAGISVRVPAPADALVLLAQHGSKHGWSSLEDVAVFGAMLARHRTELPASIELARRSGGGVALALGLELVSRVSGSAKSTPANTAPANTAPHVERLADQVERRWEAGEPAWRPTLAWDMSWAPRPRDKARLLWHSLTDATPEDQLRWPLPSALAPLHRVLRPLRLASRALRGRGAVD